MLVTVERPRLPFYFYQLGFERSEKRQTQMGWSRCGFYEEKNENKQTNDRQCLLPSAELKKNCATSVCFPTAMPRWQSSCTFPPITAMRTLQLGGCDWLELHECVFHEEQEAVRPVEQWGAELQSAMPSVCYFVYFIVFILVFSTEASC